MIMKHLRFIFGCLILTAVIMLFSSCVNSKVPSDHETTPKDTEALTDGESKHGDSETSAAPHKEHTFGEWICVDPPGNGIKGIEQRECSVCGYKEFRSIPALEFKFSQTSVTNKNKFSEYSDFNSFTSPSFIIPGLNEYFVPQGMDVWDNRNLLMISGYFSPEDSFPCSVILAIDMKTGRFVGEYYLKNSDGSYHTGHAGGVAVTEKNLFISNSNSILRIPLESFINVGYQGDVYITETIPVPSRASFCNYSGGYLWVGDFYYGKNYPTEDYSHIKNNAGKMYYAWSLGYKLDENSKNEFSSEKWNSSLPYATPDVVLSIDQKIQGFTVLSDEYIALSQSYGRNVNSKIYLYDNVLDTAPHRKVSINGKDIPLWFLDTTVNCTTYTAMPMSEGITVKDGNLYILFESGADKYRNGGGKNPTDRIWIMDIIEKTKNANLRIMTNNVWDCINNLPDWEAMGEDCSEIVRSRGFANVYVACKPDVINFQEMTPTMVKYILEDMKELGVTYSLLSYADDNQKDDTCIIYNPETVRLIESGHHIYEYGSNKNSKSYTWGLFELKSNGKRFVSLSTHLWWKSETVHPGSNEWRRMQAAEIVALSDQVLSKFDCPIFVQGDFNTQTTSSAFKEFKEGGFKLCHDIATVFKDDLRGHHKCDKEGYSTSMYGGTYTEKAIDHMLVKFQGDAEILTFKHVVEDFYYKLSDHFPLFIDVNLK